ncbi:inositol monophosphatase family protein [Haloferacaceae archaeon DSL9]
MEHTLDEFAAVATEAVTAGGAFLVSEFRDGPVDGEFGPDDVKAAVDREAERRVLSVIRESYPDHALHGEESGRTGDGDDCWIVDPLDGTNNFASGIPSFATAVCLLREGEPIVSAIYEPLPESLYLATRGGGATVNGRPISAGSGRALAHGTVAYVVGLRAIRDDALRAHASTLGNALGTRCKRVVESWSPCVDWGLLARGSIEGIVCFYPDAYEQHAGSLLAAESGVVASERDDLYVGAGDEETHATLRAAVDGADVSEETEREETRQPS